ncbi:MAG: protein nirF [Alphaproteobacteria bacterium]|nr:protein nirF [Alphaproteobacteria bacterium]
MTNKVPLPKGARGKLSFPRLSFFLAAVLTLFSACTTPTPLVSRGTSDLGIVIERTLGRVQVVETTHHTSLFTVDGLGDLSHASAVFSRDGRYAFIFGRDGGLSKVDLLSGTVVNRIVQAGNSIGGAISDDGTLIATANYDPGGIKVFDSDTLALVADLPSTGDDGKSSKVVGIEDLPGRRFIYSLYDAGEVRIADVSVAAHPVVTRIPNIGRLPYDGLTTSDGRFYIAGLFGEDGLALIDLWEAKPTARRILNHYGRGEQPLPVYKMPHLRTWAQAGDLMFLPAVGRHEVLVVSRTDWREVARIAVQGQPVFVVARPDGREVWVNFAHPSNDAIQVIDVQRMAVARTFIPGKAVLHMEFTPRGEQAWVSVRDSDQVVVYDTRTGAEITRLPADKPSGILLGARAQRMGL